MTSLTQIKRVYESKAKPKVTESSSKVEELVLTDLLPETIRILHRDFTLRERDAMELAGDNRLAEINFLKGEINFLPIRGSESADSIVHEVLHGLWKMFDLDHLNEDDIEEHVVSVLATGLVTIMRDNPTLMPVLQEIVNDSS